MRKTLIILPAAFLVACSPGLKLQSSETRMIDTVTLTETVRDTVVVIERDEAMIRAMLECDSIGQVHMKELIEYRAGSRLQPPALQVKDNILTATAACDSIAIYLQLKDRYERRITAQEQTALQTVEVNRLTGWQKMWMRAGQALVIALIFYGVFKTRKLLKI